MGCRKAGKRLGWLMACLGLVIFQLRPDVVGAQPPAGGQARVSALLDAVEKYKVFFKKDPHNPATRRFLPELHEIKEAALAPEAPRDVERLEARFLRWKDAFLAYLRGLYGERFARDAAGFEAAAQERLDALIAIRDGRPTLGRDPRLLADLEALKDAVNQGVDPGRLNRYYDRLGLSRPLARRDGSIAAARFSRGRAGLKQYRRNLSSRGATPPTAHTFSPRPSDAPASAWDYLKKASEWVANAAKAVARPFFNLLYKFQDSVGLNILPRAPAPAPAPAPRPQTSPKRSAAAPARAPIQPPAAPRRETEAQKARGRVAALNRQLSRVEGQIQQARGKESPVTEAEKAEFDRIWGELDPKRRESYIRSKLGQGHDLKNPKPRDLQDIKALKALQDYYNGLLLPGQADQPGLWESLELRLAEQMSLRDRLKSLAEKKPLARDQGALPRVAPETVQKIEGLLSEVERLRGEAKGEMATYEALSQLLAAVNKVRNQALRERRDAKEMLAFEKDMSRLATVMDLAFAMNQIDAAEKVIHQMLELLEAKLAKIGGARQQNQEAAKIADANLAELEKWKAEAQDEIRADEQRKADIAKYWEQTGLAQQSIGQFRVETANLLDAIRLRDGGDSGDPIAEYQDKIRKIAEVAQQRREGSDAFSLATLQANLDRIRKSLKLLKEGVAQLESERDPVEGAAVAIFMVVNEPEVNYSGNLSQALDRANLQRILSEREAYWQGQLRDFEKNSKSLENLLSRSNSAMTADEFGYRHKESLPLWRDEEAQILAQAQAQVRELTADIDQRAARINAVAQSHIPSLGNLGLTELQKAVKSYGDHLRVVKFPDRDDLETSKAQVDLIHIARLLPQAADELIRWSRADGTIKAINDALPKISPAQARLQALVQMGRDIVEDIHQDQVLINSDKAFSRSREENQAILTRKTILLRDKMKPALEGMEEMLSLSLIPYVKDSLSSLRSDSSGDFYKLFDAQLGLYREIKKLYEETMPWALASHGAAEGNRSEAAAKVAAWRKQFTDNLNGYDDAQGHHKGVEEFLTEVKNRDNPDFKGTEVLYGELQPFSLHRKIKEYEKERAEKAQQLKAQHAEVNNILAEIESLSKARSAGPYNLLAYRLPTDISADSAGAERVQALVNSPLIYRLGDELRRIGVEAKAEAGAEDTNFIPANDQLLSGTQEKVKVSAMGKIALLAKSAGARLVQSSEIKPGGAPASTAMARFLFADGIIKASQDALRDQIPRAKDFLTRAKQVLEHAVELSRLDEAYLNGNGETAEPVYARQLGLYAELHSFLREGLDFFDVKGQWNEDRFKVLDKVREYYQGLKDIGQGGLEVNGGEAEAARKMQEVLKKTFDQLEANRAKVARWLAQLNDPHESAVRRPLIRISEIMKETRAVLEANINYHDLKDQSGRSRQILSALLGQIEDKQNELSEVLADPALQDALPAALVSRIENLRLSRGMWAMPGEGKDKGASALVVRKSEYSAFLDGLLKMIRPQGASQDLSAIKQGLLGNPAGLSSFIPQAQVLDFGDSADGFYLVYQTRFSVPNGLETESWVTLGNIARVLGNNVSVVGWQFASPPNDRNAPYGGKGFGVQVESIQGRDWVNYFMITLHRSVLNVPKEATFASQSQEVRVQVFEDHARMLLGDTLYVAAAGYADFALNHPEEHPYYYGGNFKTSIKFFPVMRLNYEHQELWAKDPRKFDQEVNLDFAHYDEFLNRTFHIHAEGAKKHFSRDQLGPSFDIGSLLNSEDTFTLDLFLARSGGSDDITQRSAGITVLKGFTLRDDKGKPWMLVNNEATVELGEKYPTYVDRLAVNLLDQGLVFNAEGRLLGKVGAYHVGVSKTLDQVTTFNVGYGNPYPGAPPRAEVMIRTSQVLGELWDKVTGQARQDLHGGEILKPFNDRLDEFYKAEEGGPSARKVAELKRLFETDVARRLISQDMGILARDIQALRKAGAILDNTRIEGMVGFVSKPVADGQAEKALTGGPSLGTRTELTLSREQRGLIQAKAQSLYREGLRLQMRLLELAKEWQSTVVELAQAQWELKLAKYMAERAPSPALRAEGEVKAAQATARLHQALIRYNVLSGRPPTAESPFNNLNAQDIEALLAEIRSTIAVPERLKEILLSLNPEELEKRLGTSSSNFLNWMTWVEKLTLAVGVQIQDHLAGQLTGAGLTLSIPVWDPNSKAADKAFALEGRAALAEMKEAYLGQRLAAAQSFQSGKMWDAAAEQIAPRLPQAAWDLSQAIRGYRNGLVSASDLKKAFDSWQWYAETALKARSQASLAQAWAATEQGLLREPEQETSVFRLDSLGQAFDGAVRRSWTLEEVGLRQLAAKAMGEANASRIHKILLNLSVGANLTASGAGWIPQFGITGIPVWPMLGFEFKPEELKDLQVAQAEGEGEYYQALKAKIEAGLAVQLYQNIVTLNSAEAAARELESGPMTDQNRLQAGELRLGARQALAAINSLLGRHPEAPLEVSLSSERALEALRGILAAKDPQAAERKILEARLKVARKAEEIADKGLKIEQLALEPVSLAMRYLGRLVNALTSPEAADPDLVAATRAQTLGEERAWEAFPEILEQQRAKAQTALALVRAEIARLQGGSAAAGRSRLAWLKGQELALRGALLVLGEEPRPAAASQPLPASFESLKSLLIEKERRISARAPREPASIALPDKVEHRAAGFLRYFYAWQSLGKETVDKSYIEGWLELRLRSPETPPEALLHLAKLREEKMDRLYRESLAQAASRAEILTENFAAGVRLSRMAKDPEVLRRIGERLSSQRAEIVALLGLDPSTPLAALAALVPESADFAAELERTQIPRLRASLFEGGLPEPGKDEDGLMSQIRADVLAERMSYKGVTPVLAFGLFRDRFISGAFLEAPDPRAIERELRNIISEALRKELEATGRMRELSLRMHSLMSRVEDGARKVEAERLLIEAAAREYRALTGLSYSPADMGEADAARERLAAAWLAFSDGVAEFKSSFIELVTELEALGAEPSSQLRPFSAPLVRDAAGLRSDPKAELLSYWAERLADPAFEKGQDLVLDGLGGRIPTELRARLSERARLLREALRDAQAVRLRDFTPAERLELLSLNDVQGKREDLMAVLSEVLAALGALDVKENPAWGGLLNFLNKDLEASIARSAQGRADYVEAAAELRQAYWHAVPAPTKVEESFQRLEELKSRVVELRQILLQNYLLDRREDPRFFLLKDMQLDAYLRAQQDFDAELVAALATRQVKENQSLARGLDGLYDVGRVFDRAIAARRFGRGMLALDALVMLEEARLASARWSGRGAAEISAIGEALGRLKETRERWLKGGSDMTPLYAVTGVSKDGKRLWTIDGWLTAEEFEAKKKSGDILEESGRYFLQAAPGRGRYEVLSGADQNDFLRGRAEEGLAAARQSAAVRERMKRHDFALDRPAPDGKEGYSVAEIFGTGGKHSQGLVLFFRAPASGDRPGSLHDALHPLAALREAPEKYVMYLYAGGAAPPRGKFPTLESLKGSPDFKNFRQLLLSASGATALKAAIESRRDLELRRGYLELKLGGYGFARDAQGNIADMYLGEDDFKALLKAFAHAERDLERAREELAKSQAREKEAEDVLRARDEENRKAGIDYQAMAALWRERLRQEGLLQYPQREGESDEKYQARISAEIERRLVKIPDFKKTQELYAPFAKRWTEAAEKRRFAAARAANAAKAVKGAEELLEHSKNWSLYESRDMILGLDREGRLVSVKAEPVYGPQRLDAFIGAGEVAVSIQGEVWVAFADAEGRVKRYYQDRDLAVKALASCRIKSVTMEAEDALAASGRKAKPYFRMSHYEDPESGLYALINGRYLAERARGAKSQIGSARSWGVMPWNWGNIALEIPRGLVGTLKEVLLGQDMLQDGYLGRIQAYKTEGVLTERHGFFRQVLGAVDLLNLLPDPVGRIYDPSQFPAEVELDSPIRPGQNISAKGMHDPKSNKDVKYGVKSLQRLWAQNLQDVAALRLRVLSRFQGGWEEVSIQKVRGRAGSYEESSRSAGLGDKSMERELSDPLISQDPRSDGTGSVIISGDPGHLAVDRVQTEVKIRPGATQYETQSRALDGYAERLAALPQADERAPAEEKGRQERALAREDGRRGTLSRAADALTARAHRIAARLAAQKALRRHVERLRREIEAARRKMGLLAPQK
ncbi:MAG: hypothetical protein HY921_09355 [Elusimicrobia bacterium]|nr:hypothetical protein [Elusimicrobiota bacterium]